MKLETLVPLEGGFSTLTSTINLKIGITWNHGSFKLAYFRLVLGRCKSDFAIIGSGKANSDNLELNGNTAKFRLEPAGVFDGGDYHDWYIEQKMKLTKSSIQELSKFPWRGDWKHHRFEYRKQFLQLAGLQ